LRKIIDFKIVPKPSNLSYLSTTVAAAIWIPRTLHLAKAPNGFLILSLVHRLKTCEGRRTLETLANRGTLGTLGTRIIEC
jgi:hypothetical protein